MGPQELPASVLMLYKGASLLSRHDRLERTVADRNIKVYSTRHDR